MARTKRKPDGSADPNAGRSKRLKMVLRFPGYEEHHDFGFERHFREYALSVGVDIPDKLRNMEYKYAKNEGDPTVGREEDVVRRKWQKEFWGRAMHEFFNSQAGFYEEGWRAVRPLGIGGTGMAVLWERQGKHKDQSTIPSKYMVIKESLPKMWAIGSGDADESEFLIQRALTELKCDNSNILKIWRYIRFPRQQKHRYYLEWAPHETLSTLYKRYRRWRRYFPEPFIWHVFHQLAKAVLLMQKGRLSAEEVEPALEKEEADEEEEGDPKGPSTKDKAGLWDYYKANRKDQLIQLVRDRGIRVESSELNLSKEYFAQILVDDDKRATKEAKKRKAPKKKKKEGKARSETLEDFPPITGWREIVHRDMKPANIFLGEPLENSQFPAYPTIKLADFGHSIQTYEGDPTNPEDYHWKVARELDAPEVETRVSNIRQIYERLSAYTNVYQLGANIFQLATFKEDKLEIKANGKGIEFRRSRSPPCSHALLELITACMKPNPADRPTPIQLFNITRYCLDECQNYVKDNPDRFRVYFRDVEINAMETSFYKETKAIVGLQDIPFPIEDQELLPPVVARFHPYESVNLDFFEEPNNEFRNDDNDSEEEPVDALRIEDYQVNEYARRVNRNFDPNDPDSDDDDDEAATKAANRDAQEAVRQEALERERARFAGGNP